MKEWMCWVLLIIGVCILAWFAWWLTTVFDNMTIYYITVVLNGIVFGYNYYQENKAKN